VRVYVTGADGSLGTALLPALRDEPRTAEWPVLGVSVHDFDVADYTAVNDSVTTFRPDVVVHMAAISIVADCERDLPLAFRSNVAGVSNVVAACREISARMVYMSSDYVFDGASPPPDGYTETDIPNPLSVYGLAKLAGERTVTTVDNYLIIRTSWLFGGANEDNDDVLASIRQAQRGERARLICDQFARPTYTEDLARAIVHLLTLEDPFVGTVHIANSGAPASRYDMGVHAVAAFDPGLAASYSPEPVAFDDCDLVGGRPRVSTLDTSRLSGLGYSLPDWRDGVDRFCARLRRPGAR
jgi:dTDP-4-dehydrorhamnose reductase